MKCPVDDETLVMTDRNGVEIDYCPKCRGVWLDRGELDKIIERSGAMNAAAPSPTSASQNRGRSQDGHSHHQKPYQKEKETFLGKLFDF
jgi:Zn-finger nucleic acid-binding protein|tara:strand:+ start:1644 stop:1910 length:267 start_codon:yes stop_codon:yes gene_type:complete